MNDRGPFAKNRIIDISKRGAQLLGFQNKGTAKVRVEIMAEESKDLKQAILNKTETKLAQQLPEDNAGAVRSYTSQQSLKGKYFVQAGSFSSREVADDLTARLTRFGNISTMPADVNGNRYYRVRMGPYTCEADARKALAQIENFGVAGAAVIKD